MGHGGTHSENSQSQLLGGLGCGRKPKGQREWEVRARLSLVRMEPVRRNDIVKFQMCRFHVTFHLDLELEHTLDA